MVALSLAAPLSATMVLPVGELRGYWEMARSILHSIPVWGLGETFSRWHCNNLVAVWREVSLPTTTINGGITSSVFSITRRQWRMISIRMASQIMCYTMLLHTKQRFGI